MDGMTSSPARTSLSGTLHHLPFLGRNRADAVAPIYEELIAEHGVADVLVLKRFPTGIETFTDRLAAAIPGIERPRVEALTQHSASLLQATPEPPTRLDDLERGELGHTFLETTDWTAPYLAQAAAYDAFATDLLRRDW
jgi:hypothetical protein